MTTDGIEAVFLETHNWGRAAAFFQALGYELVLETDHASGQLQRAGSPYLFIAEVPDDQPLGTRLVLSVPDAASFAADPLVALDAPFEPTHWGTLTTTVHDPDGREWTLQAPA